MNQHLIFQQTIQLRLPASGSALEQQEAFSQRMQTDGLRILDEVFNEIAGEGQTLVLERLEIDLGQIPVSEKPERWKERLRNHLHTAIRKQMEQSGTKNAGAQVHTPEASAWQAWIFFLENGQLPWFADPSVRADWEQQVLSFFRKSPQQAGTALLQLLRRSDYAVFRLNRQFSAAFQLELLELTAPEIIAVMRRIPVVFNSFFNQPEPWKPVIAWIWQQWHGGSSVGAGAALEQCSSVMHPSTTENTGENTRLTAKKILEMLTVYAPLRSREIPEKTNAEKRQQIEQEGIMTDHAGLVLIAPFISAMFGHLGLVENGRFTSPEAADTGVCLLQYAATGTTDRDESGLILEKILCGLPPDWPVDTGIQLTGEQQQEVESLLETVIEYWPGLGKCSPGSLREMFLIREGRLQALPQDIWELYITVKTEDILMRRLPWSCGMIRLPWMPAMMQVEWPY